MKLYIAFLLLSFVGAQLSSDSPSAVPSDMPSDMPSSTPSDVPSMAPSLLPTQFILSAKEETADKEIDSSDFPSFSPSDVPSDVPSVMPSSSPKEQIISAETVKKILDFATKIKDMKALLTLGGGRTRQVRARRLLKGEQNQQIQQRMVVERDLIVASDVPSSMPVDMPSSMPSDVPSSMPIDMPSALPSDMPSSAPQSASPSG